MITLKTHLIHFVLLCMITALSYSAPAMTFISLINKTDPYYSYKMLNGNIKIEHDHWTFFAQPMLVSSDVGKQLMGTTFKRFGMHGRFTHSWLQYQNENFQFFLGRAPLEWGQGGKYSIIQSGSLATCDRVELQVKMNNLTGEVFTGQLGYEKTNDSRITRYIAGHRMIGRFWNDRLELQAGEQIIYTGENRSIELFYLNPAVPYVFAAFDGDDLNYGANNDNGMIFLNGRYKYSPQISLYFEFIMDDYQIDANPVQDMLGFKLGFDGQSKIANYAVNWSADFTSVDSWTYIHYGQFTNWQNRGHALGYPYGPDLRSIRLQSDAVILKKFTLDLEWIRMEKGNNSINSVWENSNTLDDPFPSKPVKIFNLFEMSVLYRTKYATLQSGYTNKPFPYEIANGWIDELKSGLFFSITLQYQRDIKLIK